MYSFLPPSYVLFGVSIASFLYFRRNRDSRDKIRSITVGDGKVLVKTAIRRCHFLECTEQFGFWYDLVRKILGSDSPTIHHYELVTWGNRPEKVGCYILSFDWAPTKGDSVDSLISLFSIRPARLQKRQWAPNEDPSYGVFLSRSGKWLPLQQKNEKIQKSREKLGLKISKKHYEKEEEVEEKRNTLFKSDDHYEYLILGERNVEIESIFNSFATVNEETRYGDASTTDVPNVIYYSILGFLNPYWRDADKAKCCYSYARMVASKILAKDELEIDRCVAEGTWVNYDTFYKQT
jgi:hypothetical protein